MFGVGALAAASGVPEASLRLLASLLATYPLGATYNHLFIKRPTQPTSLWHQHLFSIVTGLSLLWFNFGADTVHLLVAPCIVWLLLWVLGPTTRATVACFTFAMSYLLGAYAINMDPNIDYVLDWTTPYCVMCLRLIGFAMDYADGASKKSAGSQAPPKPAASSGKLRLSWDDVALDRLPSLVETLSYCLFFCGVLVGPQFPYRAYDKFCRRTAFPRVASTKTDDGNNNSKIEFPAGSRRYALRCFALGVFYFAYTEVGKMLVPPGFVITPQFAGWAMWHKLVYCALAGRVVLSKYLGVWLMNEGGCALAGISFNGLDAAGRAQWNGLMNINPWQYETVTTFGAVISSFNLNTNVWCKHYIFKRLRFLGNKTASSILTLMFLAIWHGFAPAYFLAFLTEFLDVELETIARSILRPVVEDMPFNRPLHPDHHSSVNRVLRATKSCLNWAVVVTFVGHGALTFDLLSWAKISEFWRAVYYFPLVCFAVALVLTKLRTRSVKPKKDTKAE